MPEGLLFTIRFTIFAALHSILAIPQVQKKIFISTGLTENQYRIAYNFVSVVIFIWVMSSWATTYVLYVVPGIWSLIMHCVQLILLILLLLSLRQTGLKEFLGINNDDRSDKSFVTDGFYAFVRHPVYLYSILFMLMNPVMTTRWLTLTVLSTIYMLAGALLEEKRLKKRFGDKYAEYRARVPFIVPWKLS